MSGAPSGGIRRIPFATAAERERNAASVAEHLRSGGLVAYPTETVYGFGCTLRRDALDALAALRSRSAAVANGIRRMPAGPGPLTASSRAGWPRPPAGPAAP